MGEIIKCIAGHVQSLSAQEFRPRESSLIDLSTKFLNVRCDGRPIATGIFRQQYAGLLKQLANRGTVKVETGVFGFRIKFDSDRTHLVNAFLRLVARLAFVPRCTSVQWAQRQCLSQKLIQFSLATR